MTISLRELLNIFKVPKYLVGDTSDNTDLDAEIQTQNLGIGHNLIKNGSFESWSAGTSSFPDGWDDGTGGATAARDTTDVEIGSASLQLTISTGGSQAARVRPFAAGSISATQNTGMRGKTVTVIARIKTSIADEMEILIDDGITQEISTQKHSGGGTYESIIFSATLSNTATQLAIIIGRVGTGTAGTFNVDSVQVVLGGVPTEFTQHPNDEHIRVSNFQSVSASNNTDQGVWREECGIASVVIPSATFGSKTVTFETAFRTLRNVQITRQNASNVRNRNCRTESEGASSFIILDATDDSSSTNETNTFYWRALGQV